MDKNRKGGSFSLGPFAVVVHLLVVVFVAFVNTYICECVCTSCFCWLQRRRETFSCRSSLDLSAVHSRMTTRIRNVLFISFTAISWRWTREKCRHRGVLADASLTPLSSLYRRNRKFSIEPFVLYTTIEAYPVHIILGVKFLCKSYFFLAWLI